MSSAVELRSAHRAKINLKTLRTLLPTILGTVIEYYDYALYGFCASFLAPQFFPSADPTVAFLKTYAIFLAGSFSKPLGALIFGYIGDRFGRRISLQISMIGIAVPTTLIGLAPSYAEIGWFAPCLILFFRMIQGACTAGESDGARIVIFESIGKDRPCFANSLAGIASLIGIYLASFISAKVMKLEFLDYAWRLPFLIGGVLGLFVYCFRTTLHESIEFIYSQEKKAKLQNGSSSLLKVLIKNKKAILATTLLCGASGGTYHFYLVFFGNYVSSILNILDPIQASSNTSTCILIYALCAPVAGIVADHFGATKTLKISAFFLFFLVLLNAFMLHQAYIPAWLLLLTSIVLCFFQAPGFAIILQKFNVGERYQCTSFGHAIGSMLFSGSAPFISLWLWRTTGIEIMPLLYFAMLIAMGFTAIFLLEE